MKSEDRDWTILEDKIREKINMIVYQDDSDPIDDHTELLQSGRLSSMSLIELLAMIEKETRSRVVDDDVSIGDFSSIKKILSVAKSAWLQVMGNRQ